MDTSTHKSVAIDIDTWRILTQAADAECRSVAMQIRWLVKNSNSGSPMPSQIPIATVTPVMRRKKTGYSNGLVDKPDTQLNQILSKFSSGLTLCAKDFEDVLGKGKEASSQLHALSKRGDIAKINTVVPFYYQLTNQGIARLRKFGK